MTQIINNNPAPSVHSAAAAPSSKTEAANNINNKTTTNKQTKARKFSKRVSWSVELTSVRLITPEVKAPSFRPFPILEEDEESEVIINTENINHLL